MAAQKQPLSLDMSADPTEFTEAVDEFSSRRVITREEADTLEGYARRRAWWISGVAHMDVVADTQQSIVEAMRDGDTFEEWKKKARGKLEREWGRRDSARLQLIFRNATTSAYNAGRLEQMEKPHIVAVRPFKMLSVVTDLRTSDICSPLANPPIVLPWDHPRWLTLSPPLHHGCRTGIRSLSNATAQRYGVMTEPPVVDVQDGWGIKPTIVEPPKPSERTIQPDPEIALEMANKAWTYETTAKPVKISKRVITEPKPQDPLPFEELPSGKPPKRAKVPLANDSMSRKKALANVKLASKERLQNVASSAEIHSITRFTEGLSHDIRSAATLSKADYDARRMVVVSYEEAHQHAKNIESAIAKAATMALVVEAEVPTVYRGLSNLSRADLDAILGSTEIAWTKPTSTSWDPAIAGRFYSDDEGGYGVLMVIKTASRTRGLSIEGVSSISDEREVLFGDGSRFRVTRRERDPQKRGAIVYLEEL
jgi:hypothetical protein